MFILHFSNGRHHPDERLEGWGLDGPMLGPVEAVHLDQGGLAVRLPGALPAYELPMIDGLVFYGGLFFADVEVLDAQDTQLEFGPAVEPFDATDAQLPRWAWKLQRGPTPVKLKRADLPAFRDAVAVFCDRVAEIAGERSSKAARRALSQVVTDYAGRRPVSLEVPAPAARGPNSDPDCHTEGHTI